MRVGKESLGVPPPAPQAGWSLSQHCRQAGVLTWGGTQRGRPWIPCSPGPCILTGCPLPCAEPPRRSMRQPFEPGALRPLGCVPSAGPCGPDGASSTPRVRPRHPVPCPALWHGLVASLGRRVEKPPWPPRAPGSRLQPVSPPACVASWVCRSLASSGKAPRVSSRWRVHPLHAVPRRASSADLPVVHVSAAGICSSLADFRETSVPRSQGPPPFCIPACLTLGARFGVRRGSGWPPSSRGWSPATSLRTPWRLHEAAWPQGAA